METINDVVYEMNNLYFKALLREKDYHIFDDSRQVLNTLLRVDDDKCELETLSNMLDDIHINFLTVQLPDNEMVINEFRRIVFEQIKLKLECQHEARQREYRFQQQIQRQSKERILSKSE